MRLWSLHPRYLDRAGLTGGWRDALLAQAVLAGRTTGYRAHPQLSRFRLHPDPHAAMGAFLSALADEAEQRGYRFDRSRIDRPAAMLQSAGVAPIVVTQGQVAFEWQHLLAKLALRSPERHAAATQVQTPELHPLFVLGPGPVEEWERMLPRMGAPRHSGLVMAVGKKAGGTKPRKG